MTQEKEEDAMQIDGKETTIVDHPPSHQAMDIEDEEEMPRAHPRHLFKSSAHSSPAKSDVQKKEEEEEDLDLPVRHTTARQHSHHSSIASDKIDFEAIDPELYGLRRSGRERVQRVIQVVFSSRPFVGP